MSGRCSNGGAVWYKLSDVKKAFNMICPEDRDSYKIIELQLKVTDIQEY
jgi:hypothetical protein